MLVYRLFVADGKPGAAGRVAARLGVSRQRVDQIVKRHETQHPVILRPVGKNTPEAPFVRLEPSCKATGHAGDSHDSGNDDASLEYVDPPFGYPRPEPRRIAQSAMRDPLLETLIMSNLQPASPVPMQVFERAIAMPMQVQGSGYSPIANARLAANVSYAVAVAMTVVLLPVMIKDARLLVCLPVLLLAWAAAGEAARWYRRLTQEKEVVWMS